MRHSVCRSTLEVKSSRIRMRGSIRRARAMAIRWRWPPEASGRVRPPGSHSPAELQDELVGGGGFGAASITLFLTGLRTAEGDVVADRTR